MGKSPENRQPLKDRFQTVPVPVYEPMRYFTKHCNMTQRRLHANAVIKLDRLRAVACEINAYGLRREREQMLIALFQGFIDYVYE